MDALERLVTNAETLLKEGYYDVRGETDRSPSFLDALSAPTRTSDVVSELKFASPTMRSQKAAHFDATPRWTGRLAGKGLPIKQDLQRELHVEGFSRTYDTAGDFYGSPAYWAAPS